MLDASPIAFALPPCDSSADITDLWQENTDPAGELGQSCEAHFVHHASVDRAGLNRRGWRQEYRPELVGLTVSGSNAGRGWSVVVSRSTALAALGRDGVAALERDLSLSLEDFE